MINSLQHIGQGVWDIDNTYDFYKKNLGFKFKINDLEVEDEDMARVIGSVETIRTLMALNVNGGGVLELVEHKSMQKIPYTDERLYGNYGILEVGYGVGGIEKVVSNLSDRGINILAPISEIQLENGKYWRYSFIKDPDGMMLQLVEEIEQNGPKQKKPQVQGVIHAGIGVSDLERSRKFYKSVLGFDKVLYEFEGHIPGMDGITRKPLPMKMVILQRSESSNNADDFLPAGIIKLFNVPGFRGKHIYKGRHWGDIGCMELSFDVSNLENLVAEIKSKGVKIYLPPVEIDMGSGSKGSIAYIRDPDGTVLEFVEIKTVAWLSTSTFKRLAIPLLRAIDRLGL